MPPDSVLVPRPEEGHTHGQQEDQVPQDDQDREDERRNLAIIEKQLQRFREKFGREPGPKDPIFFDPDSLTPEPFRLEAYLE